MNGSELPRGEPERSLGSNTGNGDVRPFRVESTSPIHEGWTSLQRVTITDGNRRQEREIAHHGDAAAVLAYDPDRRVALLVRVLRAPLVMAGEAGWSLEAPAGILDAGEGFADAALRETAEETGVDVTELEHVATVWSSPGTSRERVGLFLATYRSGAGLKAADEEEMVRPLEIRLDEFLRMLEQGRIDDMKTLTLALALRHRRPDLFA